MPVTTSERQPNRYSVIIAQVFANHYGKGLAEFEFTRDEFASIAEDAGFKLPKNIGDVIYSFRYRTKLPQSICDTAAKGRDGS